MYFVYCKSLTTSKTRHILLSNFTMKGKIIGTKKEDEKSFYSLILLEQRFSLKIFLAKYVRILVKSVQLGYSSGNLSESLRIYQRPGASKPRIQGIVSVLPGKILRYFYNSERYSLILLRPAIMLVYSHCRWSSEWYECFKFNGLFQIWKVDLLFLGQNFM